MKFLLCVPVDDDADDDLGIVVKDDFELVGASCVVEECRCKGLALFSKRLDRHQSEYKARCLVLKKSGKCGNGRRKDAREELKMFLVLRSRERMCHHFPIYWEYNILGI